MTPSNPSNNQPFIYRFLDALGIPHQVVCVHHTHAPSEVEGLDDTLNELWAGVNEKADAIEMTDALAEKMPLMTVDNSPTQDSANLVKSGGVYAALASKMPIMTVDASPAVGSSNLVTSGGVYNALAGKVGEGDFQELLSRLQPEYTEDPATNGLDLDGIMIGDMYPKVRHIIAKNGENAITFANIGFSSLYPIMYCNGSTSIPANAYVACTAILIEEGTSYQYLVTLDGKFS